MNLLKKISMLWASALFFGACASNEVTPDPIPVQPQTLTILTYNDPNPTSISYTWKDNLITSYTTKTLNVSLNKDFIRKYDMLRNDRKLIESVLYTYEGGGFQDGNTTQTYIYNADKTQINYLSTNWTFNKLGNLLKLNYGSRSISGLVEYEYNAKNLLNKVQWKEGSYLDNTNTITEFTNIQNPLFNIAKSLQFLNVIFNNAELTMTSSQYIPKSYNNGAIDNFVAYEMDSQNRVNSITVSNNGIILKKYNFTY